MKNRPQAALILGEELVVLRDGRGRNGVLARHCSHRGASLEYARVLERGIQCCYHGWHFDIDGRILATPGEPARSTRSTRCVIGNEISRPLDEDTVRLLRSRMHEHGLLLFRNQQLDEEQQVRFALYFGRISKQGAIQRTAPAATYVSNVRDDGTFGKGELGFHSDQCYYAHPMKAIMLYGVEVPVRGGETLFANTAEVVRSLPPDLRAELAATKVRHEFDYGALEYGAQKMKQVEALKVAAEHPIVARHPWSDQMVLMANAATAVGVVGATPERSREIIRMLAARVADPAHVYRHKWEKGDLILWDNLLLQHARSHFDASERRTLRRCAIGNEQEES